MRKLKRVLLTTGVFLAGQSLWATSLLPGGTVNSPPNVTAAHYPTGVPLISDPYSGALGSYNTPASWKTKPPNPKTLATLAFEQAVYYDPTTRGLDFFYQVQNVYTGSTTANDTMATTFDLTGFSGITTDVYQITNTSTPAATIFGGGAAHFVRPTADTVTKIKRTTNLLDGGDTLIITLSTTGLVPKTNSAIIEVKTNATNFDVAGQGEFAWKGSPTAGATGSASTILFDLNSLEPFVPVPEPGFYGTLSLSLGIMFAVRKRTKFLRN